LKNDPAAKKRIENARLRKQRVPRAGVITAPGIALPNAEESETAETEEKGDSESILLANNVIYEQALKKNALRPVVEELENAVGLSNDQMSNNESLKREITKEVRQCGKSEYFDSISGKGFNKELVEVAMAEEI